MENNKKNLFLIGFMGCGKSTMARILSQETGQELIEMDETIEKEAGCTINEIFETHGESYFRDLESALVERIAQKGGAVVSCGGGAVLRKENVENMKKNGRIVYLSATPETIFQRVRYSKNRPLLNGNMNIEFIRQLMEKRLAIYEQSADDIVCVDGKEKREIVEELKGLGGE